MTEEEREAWLEWRRGGIGSSDIAAIVGVSPFAGPWDVWMSKVHGATSEDTPSMEVGRRLERAIGEWAAERLAADLALVDAFAKQRLEEGVEAPALVPGSGTEGPSSWMRCTPDFHWRFAGLGGFIECKKARTPGEEWGPDGSDVVPVHYFVQVQWQIACLGAQKAHLAVLFTLTDEFRLYTIERDEALISSLVARAGQWWQKHVLEGVEPDLDGSATATAYQAKRYGRDVDAVREATPREIELAERYAVAKARKKKIEGLLARLRQELIRSMGDEATLLIADGVRVSHKAHETRRLDLDLVRNKIPKIADLLDSPDFRPAKKSARFTVSVKEKK